MLLQLLGAECYRCCSQRLELARQTLHLHAALHLLRVLVLMAGPLHQQAGRLSALPSRREESL